MVAALLVRKPNTVSNGLIATREGDDKTGAIGIGGIEADLSAQRIHQTTAYRKAKANTYLEVITLLEGLKDALMVFFLDAAASIRHDEAHLTILKLTAQFYRSFLCELHGIVNQMGQGILQPIGTRANLEVVRQVRIKLQHHARILLAFGFLNDPLTDVVNPDICLFFISNNSHILALREFQVFIDNGSCQVYITSDTYLHVTFLLIG